MLSIARPVWPSYKTPENVDVEGSAAVLGSALGASEVRVSPQCVEIAKARGSNDAEILKKFCRLHYSAGESLVSEKLTELGMPARLASGQLAEIRSALVSANHRGVNFSKENAHADAEEVINIDIGDRYSVLASLIFRPGEVVLKLPAEDVEWAGRKIAAMAVTRLPEPEAKAAATLELSLAAMPRLPADALPEHPDLSAAQSRIAEFAPGVSRADLLSIGRNPRIIDARPNQDGVHINLLISSVHRKTFWFLAGEKWSEVVDGYAYGGYYRKLSLVRTNPADEKEGWKVLGEIRLDAYKSYAAGLDGSGAKLGLWVHEGNKAKEIKEFELSGNKFEETARHSFPYQENIHVHRVDYDKDGNLWVASGRSYYGVENWSKAGSSEEVSQQ